MADDKAARSEYYRQWRARNRERTREYERKRNTGERRQQSLERLRQWAEANPDRKREANRRYRQDNPEKVKAVIRRWREENQDRVRTANREWYQNNRERARETSRRSQGARRARGYVVPSRVRRRQITAEWWHKQDGRCYLCKESLPMKAAVLDHDHRCCPAEAFCNHCIRGAACNQCNTAIGLMRDDPDRMESVARVLRSKLAEMDERLAIKPEQLTLDDVS